MSKFETFFENAKNSDDYEQNAHVIEYLGNILKNIAQNPKKPLPPEETHAIREFAATEMKRLLDAIPKAGTYREKDTMFYYENSLLMVYTLAGKDMCDVSDEHIKTIEALVKLINGEREFENAVESMLKSDKVEKADADAVIVKAKKIKDEYLRGKLYHILNEYKENIKIFTPEAKNVFSAYIAEDMEKLLKKAESSAEAANSLELAADVCKYFINDKIFKILGKILTLKIDSIRYYALETLLINAKELPSETVAELAKDLSYASLTYSLLVQYGKSELFPKEYSTPEYLAKSDMVHWLIFPTELNKEPDEIELLGTAKVKNELYHIFKYKSDSENLDDLAGEWLIGWSGNMGGTFSNFDKLSDFEEKTPEKTLKNIVKKLLK